MKKSDATVESNTNSCDALESTGPSPLFGKRMVIRGFQWSNDKIMNITSTSGFLLKTDLNNEHYICSFSELKISPNGVILAPPSAT